MTLVCASKRRCKTTPLPSRVSVSDSSSCGINLSLSVFLCDCELTRSKFTFLIQKDSHSASMRKEITNQAIALSVLLTLLALAVECRPRYIECNNTLECGLGYCCVLGNGRYSLPRCLPLGKVNDECRPLHHPPLNVTVSYPDGESVELTHVYSTMCPCQAGLYCSDRSGFCRDPLEDIISNKIE